MNDSLDLRNRILKMRESNDLIVPKEDSLNNNLMSKFESSIKDDSQKLSVSNNKFCFRISIKKINALKLIDKDKKNK